MRWQQLTGPATAKGLEDTAIYNYDGLLALADVGADPSDPVVEVEEFHRRMRARALANPTALNATSTHDSKRSEDVRARLAVLSEIPDVWERQVTRWGRLMREHVTSLDAAYAPDPREESHIYQAVVGAWPLQESGMRGFSARMQDHVVKMAREAKRNTSWLEQNDAHERALRRFVRALLSPSNVAFRRDVERLLKRIGLPGALNGLAQMVMKIASPGVPDFYQGSELWHLALVDPDNRRPVDFGTRRRAVRSLHSIGTAEARKLLSSWEDGRIKMHVMRRALGLRAELPDVFEQGRYVPLEVSGRFRKNIVAFARRRGRRWVVSVVPRLVTDVMERGRPPVGERWSGTTVRLPPAAPRSYVDGVSGREVQATGSRLRLSEVLEDLPVALLASR